MTASTQLDSRSCRALSQAVSWLTASGIQNRYLGDLDLGVISGNGAEVRVRVALDDAPMDGAGCSDYILRASRILDTDMPRALEAFKDLTEAIGFGRNRVPVDRGAVPDHRLHYGNDFELVSMRHREFRRAPNPSPEDMKKYQKVMVQECNRFYGHPGNRGLCYRNGIDWDDLGSYARIWTTNYLALYRVLREVQDDNFRKLKIHLRKRFWEFGDTLSKKQRSCLPCAEAAFLGATGSTQAEAIVIRGPDDTVLDVSVPTTENSCDRLSRAFEALTFTEQKLALEKVLATPKLSKAVKEVAERKLKALVMGEPEEVPGPGEFDLSEKPQKRGSGRMLYPEEYAQAVAKLPPTKSCPRCGKEGPTLAVFGLRLMNKKEIGTQKRGQVVGPKFAVIPQCQKCRVIGFNKKSAETGGQAQEQEP